MESSRPHKPSKKMSQDDIERSIVELSALMKSKMTTLVQRFGEGFEAMTESEEHKEIQELQKQLNQKMKDLIKMQIDSPINGPAVVADVA